VFSCVCMDHYIFLNTKMYNIAIQMSLCYEFVCVVRGPNPFPRHRHKNDPSPHTTFAKEQRGNLFHLFLSLCFWKKIPMSHFTRPNVESILDTGLGWFSRMDRPGIGHSIFKNVAKQHSDPSTLGCDFEIQHWKKGTSTTIPNVVEIDKNSHHSSFAPNMFGWQFDTVIVISSYIYPNHDELQRIHQHCNGPIEVVPSVLRITPRDPMHVIPCSPRRNFAIC
jgi:hypothetical protein